jgi:CheY-like chemotaxis protein
VIVSDIGMPEMDGYKLMRQVRRLPAAEGGRLPAIALTAFARSEDRTRAMMAGFQMHIAKPIEPQELVATVANLAGRISKNIEKNE